MREAVVAFVERAFAGRRVPPALEELPERELRVGDRRVFVGWWDIDGELRVRVDGEGHRNAQGDDPVGEALAVEIARRLDAELATGGHDRLFGGV
jgi:hypothetical protein